MYCNLSSMYNFYWCSQAINSNFPTNNHTCRVILPANIINGWYNSNWWWIDENLSYKSVHSMSFWPHLLSQQQATCKTTAPNGPWPGHPSRWYRCQRASTVRAQWWRRERFHVEYREIMLKSGEIIYKYEEIIFKSDMNLPYLFKFCSNIIQISNGLDKNMVISWI